MGRGISPHLFLEAECPQVRQGLEKAHVGGQVKVVHRLYLAATGECWNLHPAGEGSMQVGWGPALRGLSLQVACQH